MQKIGFLGPKGTFSQDALGAYLKGKNNYEAVAYPTIPELILAVEKEEIQESILPIENSLEGAVNSTLDMLSTDVNLMIKAEAVINVKQNLLVKKDTQFSDILVVISHPQPIGQCRRFINEKLPNAVIKYVYSTAEAAKEVAESDGKSLAAIGSISAAEVYGLDILESSIEDEDNNLTRFVVIGKTDSQRTGKDKTSIVFSTDNTPGSLYCILQIFSLWNINMTRIESRPAKYQLGRYIFFIDIMGHRDDEDVRDALTMIRRKTTFYKFLGSYRCQEESL